MRRRRIHTLSLLVTVALAAAACSSDDSGEPAAPTSTTEPDAADGATADGMDVRTLVETLASDEMNGRDNDTPESTATQELLIGELSQFAEPVAPDVSGDDGYLQAIDQGQNVIGVIPGGELADEYVMIGAHYDHLGNDCDGITADDDICNGAADNATGVAAAMDISRRIATEGTPRRSIIVALWDREEDGLLGAEAWVEDPLVPLDQTIGYVNFDIQGLNLLPSLANATVLVGAETGGQNLVDAATQATEASTLDTVMLSLLFGQGRSDHAELAAAGVPSVFLTDANNGCYHTVKDDIDGVDFAKLDQQINTADALMRDLVETDTPPEFDPDAPASTFEDAVQLLRIISGAEPDFDLLDAEQQASTQQYLADLQGIVDAGEESFDDDANGVVLGGAAEFVQAVADADCDPFIS